MGKKETFYFSHDYGARNDPKLVKVHFKLGHAGIGVYWCLIEMLYEQGGRLQLDEIDNYAYALRADESIIMALFTDFNLFQNDGVEVWSASADTRLNARKEKSEKALKSANARWKKTDHNLPNANANALEIDANACIDESDCNANALEIDANALQSQSERNAIKERIVKDNKVKNNKVNIGGESSRFLAPSNDDVFSFFLEKAPTSNWSESTCQTQAGKFVNFYESKNWMVGKSKMAKWKASAANWIANNAALAEKMPASSTGVYTKPRLVT